MTQRDQLLTYLEAHGRINPGEAWKELGIYRLAARVKELRESGYPIVTERVDGHAVYVLERTRTITVAILGTSPLVLPGANPLLPSTLWSEGELREAWGK